MEAADHVEIKPFIQTGVRNVVNTIAFPEPCSFCSMFCSMAKRRWTVLIVNSREIVSVTHGPLYDVRSYNLEAPACTQLLGPHLDEIGLAHHDALFALALEA